MATPLAERERQRLFAQLGWPAHQTLAFHWARLVEALQAAETVALLVRDPDLVGHDVRNVPAALAGPREGVGVVEAPRGTLIHHYAVDARGVLTAANLVVASQHNAGSVQISVQKAARGLVRGGRVDEGLLNTLEMAFRAYDPCNACASHALPGELPLVVTLRGRDGAVHGVVRRNVPDAEGA
jgi:F420-non-reducing hydrogenase large subunit